MIIRGIKKIGYNIVRSFPPSIRSPIYHLARNFGNYCTKMTGRWCGNAVPAYWFRESVNFGDLLTPALLKYYGFSPYFSDSPLQGKGETKDMVIVGSILGIIHPEFRGIILGSGSMYDKPRELPHALFLAVRGELTKKLYQCPDSVVLGDPGLLADRLLMPSISKKHRLGIVLHQSELDANLWKGKFDPEAKIIDSRRYPGDVLRDIAE